MRKSIIALALLSVSALAGCMQDPLSRGAAGAVAGAAVADITDSSVGTGAIIGGLAGAASCTLPGQCYRY